jgi:hypothetical protein
VAWLQSELYRPCDRRLSAKLVPTFTDTGCHVVSATDPYGRILGFLDRSRYFVFQVAPQLYSRGWVHPVQDPLLFFVVPGNRTRDPCICSQELWPLDHRGGLCQSISHPMYFKICLPPSPYISLRLPSAVVLSAFSYLIQLYFTHLLSLMNARCPACSILPLKFNRTPFLAISTGASNGVAPSVRLYPSNNSGFMTWVFKIFDMEEFQWNL